MTWVKKLGPVILILVLIGCVFGPAVFFKFSVENNCEPYPDRGPA